MFDHSFIACQFARRIRDKLILEINAQLTASSCCLGIFYAFETNPDRNNKREETEEFSCASSLLVNLAGEKQQNILRWGTRFGVRMG